jgi:hypothetical protein
VAGAGDHGGLHADRLTEITLPAARQGRPRLGLFKADRVSGVSIAVFHVQVARVRRKIIYGSSGRATSSKCQLQIH